MEQLQLQQHELIPPPSLEDDFQGGGNYRINQGYQDRTPNQQWPPGTDPAMPNLRPPQERSYASDGRSAQGSGGILQHPDSVSYSPAPIEGFAPLAPVHTYPAIVPTRPMIPTSHSYPPPSGNYGASGASYDFYQNPVQGANQTHFPPTGLWQQNLNDPRQNQPNNDEVFALPNVLGQATNDGKAVEGVVEDHSEDGEENEDFDENIIEEEDEDAEGCDEYGDRPEGETRTNEKGSGGRAKLPRSKSYKDVAINIATNNPKTKRDPLYKGNKLNLPGMSCKS